MDLRGDQKSSQICLKVADILIWYNSTVVHLKEQKITLHLPKDMFTRFSTHDMLNIFLVSRIPFLYQSFNCYHQS